MTIASSDPDARKKLIDTVQDKRAQIVADNEAAKAERNARRWKRERDPVEYEKQKTAQREAYAAQIAAEEGREVRAYVRVPGTTREEHEENAKARDAARKREARSRASQEAKDRDADNRAVRRWRKKGWTEAQIADELAKRAAGRLHRQPDPGEYEDNPLYGAF